MKKLIVIISALTLTACVTRRETWEVTYIPVHWEEEIILPADHFHIYDSARDTAWRCYVMPVDTFCWVHRDTLVIRRNTKTIFTRMNIKSNSILICE